MSNERTRPQVLVVEDEAWILELWIEELSETGPYEVIGAKAAAPALALLATTGVDAAIIDIGLPDMRGEALIAAARELHPSLPILAVTGFDAADYRHLSDYGVRVLQKPFRSSWLLFNLNALLTHRAYDEQRSSSPQQWLRAAC